MPVENALELFLAELNKLNYFQIENEEIDLYDSLNRITSEAIFAKRSSPHYVASAMDGISVKAEDTVGASETQPLLLQQEQYFELDTGDYVPREWDAVIMIEDTNFIDSTVEIIKAAVPWQNIRSVGEDLVAQDMLLPALTRITAYELASMKTAGLSKVPVLKKPIVGIIPTGSELVENADLDMSPGKIVDTNSLMLSALCEEWGAYPIRHPIVPDDPELIKSAIESLSSQSDILIVCSGSSAGKEDYTSAIINDMGKILVHGLAVRPGKPAILGIIKDKPVIGVPGYPISAALIFNLFAQVLIYKKQGLEVPLAQELECKIIRKTASHMGVDEYIQVNVAKIKNDYLSFPLGRGAGICTSLVKTDGHILIKRGNEGIKAGEISTVYLSRPKSQIDNNLLCIGSHDMSIDILTDILQRKSSIRLLSSNVGSMGGIMSLQRNETHMAGIHLLDEESETYNIAFLKKFLLNTPWILVNLVKREQGLLVAKGNPLGIKGIKDLKEKNIRYLNRQRGAGTRILFDYLLEKAGISSDEIYGYQREEYTHLAIGAAIKNDAADAALGIYASARVMDLDFIPIVEEKYDLCLLTDNLNEDKINILIDCIKSHEFKQNLDRFGGYNLSCCGNILAEQK